MRSASASYARSRSGLDEHTLRLGAGLLILLIQFDGMLGLAWDIQWHISVGRDRFWTPPHILLYSSTALRGILAVAIVLWETWRYHRRAGVTDANSVRVFGLFHAPIGFVLLGFGALTTALAAPLDDYWHQLYGVDVALWAPFHSMGSLGGFMAGLGSVYVWASLVASRPQAVRMGSQGRPRWTMEKVGFVLALLFLMSQMITLSWPAQLQTTLFPLGPLSFMLYPVLLALGLLWLMGAANDTLGLRGAASLLAVFMILRDLIVQLFVPWAVQRGAAAEGLPFRSTLVEPHFSIAPLVFDVGLLIVALIADGLAGWIRRQAGARGNRAARPVMRAMIASIPLYALGVWATTVIWNHLANVPLPAEIPIGTRPDTLAIALALPVTLAFAAFSGWLGGGLSHVWRRSTR